MLSDTPEAVTNRAPVCVTCRYSKPVEVTDRTWAGTEIRRTGFLGLRKVEVTYPPRVVKKWCCQIARNPVTGVPAKNRPCDEERSDPSGCGPEGRNWMHNPEWIADIRERGLDLHPDLEALYQQDVSAGGLVRMPKEFWQMKRDGAFILAATHGRLDAEGFYRIHWTKYRALDLPNNLISADDLERFLVEPVNVSAV